MARDTQGILIPLWIGWCENSPIGTAGRPPNEPLSQCAREVPNLGNIRSDVKVDGISVAKLDVRMSDIWVIRLWYEFSSVRLSSRNDDGRLRILEVL